MSTLDCPVARNDWIQEVQRNGISGEPRAQKVGEAVADAGPWEPVVRKLVHFQDLAHDWDGFGAQAPSREVLESAIGLAYVFSEKGVDPPTGVVHGVDGTVLFEWQFSDGTYAEVEIDGPMHAEVMLIEPGKPATHWTLPTE